MAYSVQITTYPEGAKIYLGGKFYDYTNYWLHGLEGNLTVKVTLSGYSDWNFTISPADSGKTIHHDFKTPPAKAQIYITSNPSGARIYGDGVDTGLTTPATWWPGAGYHSITLKLAGYEDLTFTGTYAAGQFIAPATMQLKEIIVPKPRKIVGHVYQEVIIKAF